MTKPLFEPGDIEVMAMALEQHPDLEAAAYVVKLARARGLKYPVTAADGLSVVVKHGPVDIRHMRLTLKHAERFVPEPLFPIESEADLMRKLLLAFVIGRGAHHKERGDKSVGPVGALVAQEV